MGKLLPRVVYFTHTSENFCAVDQVLRSFPDSAVLRRRLKFYGLIRLALCDFLEYNSYYDEPTKTIYVNDAHRVGYKKIRFPLHEFIHHIICTFKLPEIFNGLLDEISEYTHII